MNAIFHICRRVDWDVPGSDFRDPSLASEGFIHCSTRAQVGETANALFRGQEGLVLLVIDPSRTAAPVVFEDCYEKGQAFPHIYGPLNRDAVLRVVDFPPGLDGRFSLPGGL